MTIYTSIHVVSLILFAVATLALLFYFIPRARAETDPQSRLARAASAMKMYDPFCIAVLGVMIMSGAFALTAVKDALREQFFIQKGAALTWKLSFTFLLIIVASYLAFGLGNRLVGKAEIGEATEPAWVSSVLTRIQTVAVVELLLCAIITWIAWAM